jgi:hypothetical protein
MNPEPDLEARVAVLEAAVEVLAREALHPGSATAEEWAAVAAVTTTRFGIPDPVRA